jgi:hypothetical protein
MVAQRNHITTLRLCHFKMATATVTLGQIGQQKEWNKFQYQCFINRLYIFAYYNNALLMSRKQPVNSTLFVYPGATCKHIQRVIRHLIATQTLSGQTRLRDVLQHTSVSVFFQLKLGIMSERFCSWRQSWAKACWFQPDSMLSGNINFVYRINHINSKIRRCLGHNLCSQTYGSKSLVRSI